MRSKWESLSFLHAAGPGRKAAAPRKVSCGWGAIVEAAADFKAVKERDAWARLESLAYKLLPQPANLRVSTGDEKKDMWLSTSCLFAGLVGVCMLNWGKQKNGLSTSYSVLQPAFFSR